MPETAPSAPTLVDLLQQQAQRHTDKVAFRFCPDGDEEHDRLTYRELDHRARAVAAGLQAHGAAGQRVLIFGRPGLDSVAGFFGCLYARAVAVPVDAQWTSARIEAIVPDARAEIALATTKTQAKIRAAADDAAGDRPLQWFATEELAADDPAADRWALPPVTATTHAAIQYTSGTTKAPKGVVLTHGNFMHNLETIRQTWNPAPDNPVFHRPVGSVCWLPQYHDLGLIGGILMTLYVGTTTVVMSPGSFLMRPMRWLEAMSRHGAVISGAPNFAYEWCLKRSTPQQRAELDLSHWEVALNGGEPVNPATLQGFSEAFAPAGFNPEAFLPVYGLAESTLGVSGGSDSALPVIAHVDRGALGDDRVAGAAPVDAAAVAVGGCGGRRGGQRVSIADPEPLTECGSDGVGEIWVSGPSGGQGYWRRHEETEQTFAARPADTGAGPCLRTGDRGFLRGGELFVTGRCKDLVVIDDVIHYPNDIERTVADCDPVLLNGRGAAFVVAGKSPAPERLAVVQEVQRHRDDGTDLDAVIEAIRAAIVRHHRVEAHHILLVKPMRIPTTSSGKIQRAACRERFNDNDLEPLAQWDAPESDGPPLDGKQQV